MGLMVVVTLVDWKTIVPSLISPDLAPNYLINCQSTFLRRKSDIGQVWEQSLLLSRQLLINGNLVTFTPVFRPAKVDCSDIAPDTCLSTRLGWHNTSYLSHFTANT